MAARGSSTALAARVRPRELPSGIMELHCLFRDQTEEWVVPDARDVSLCFIKQSSASPRVADSEVERARRPTC